MVLKEEHFLVFLEGFIRKKNLEELHICIKIKTMITNITSMYSCIIFLKNKIIIPTIKNHGQKP